jgi:cellulose biosynthesis protein BcsQ
MTQPTTHSRWETLYNKPNPVKIFELSAQDFKEFIRYVFQRSGYQVVDSPQNGAALELRNQLYPLGYVALSSGVQHVGPNPVLALNGLPVPHDMEKYYISSGGFASTAIQDAAAAKQTTAGQNLRLIDSDKLQRYINYVRGTRHPKAQGAPLTPIQLFDYDPVKRSPTKTKVLTLANNKGGVCKTTSALAIALILATEKQKKVLLVDVDEQANLTQVVLEHASELSHQHTIPNIADHFLGSAPMSQLIMPTRYNNIWIIPSDSDLRLTLSSTVDWTQTEKRFIDALHHDTVVVPNSGADFDWIIIDTPPSISLHTRSALLAAHFVAVPFTPSGMGRRGLLGLITTLDDIRGMAAATQQTELIGCFPTRWRRSAATRDDLESLQQLAISAGAPIFASQIADDPNNSRKIIGETTPKVSGLHGMLDDYRDLVKEIQNHVGDN